MLLCERPLPKGQGREARFVILTVGLDHRAAGSIQRSCTPYGWICDHVHGVGEALDYLRTRVRHPPAAVFCAEMLSDGCWLHLLDWVEIPLIVVSRLADERLWAEALNLGARDLLPNPFTEMELRWTIDSVRMHWERGQPCPPATMAAGLNFRDMPFPQKQSAG